MSMFKTASGQAAKVDQFKLNRSVIGAVIPLLYGTQRLSPYFLVVTDFQAKQDNPGKFSVGGKAAPGFYRYSITGVQGLCLGQIDDVGAGWMSGGAGINNVRFSRFDIHAKWFIANGAYGQAPWSYLAGAHPELAFGFTGVAYVAAANWSLGGSAQPPQVSYEVAGRLCKLSLNYSNWAPQGGINDAVPSDIIADFLTDARVGLGLPADWIGRDRPQKLYVGAVGFAEFSEFTRAQNIWLSVLMDQQQPASSWIDTILQITNCELICSNAGLLVVPYCDQAISFGVPSWSSGAGGSNPPSFTPATTPVRTFSDSDYLPMDGVPVQVTRVMPQDIYNSVRVNFTNRGADYRNDHIDVQEQASIEQLGLKPTQSYDWARFICTPWSATTAAILRLRRLAYSGNSYKFKVGSQHIDLEPMDAIALNDSALGLAGQLAWITDIEEDGDYNLTITAIDQFPATTQQYAYQTPMGGSGIDAGTAPGPTQAVIIEPYSQMTLGNYQIWFCVSGQGNWGGCNIYMSLDGTNYNQIGVANGRNPNGSWVTDTPGAGTSSSTVVDVTQSGAALTSVTAAMADAFQNISWLDGEVISWETATQNADGTYTLTYQHRQVYDSPPNQNTTGKPFAFLGSLSAPAPGIFMWTYPAGLKGTTLHFKLQSFNGGGLNPIPLNEVTDIPFTVMGAGHTGTYIPFGQHAVSQFTPNPSGAGVVMQTSFPTVATIPAGATGSTAVAGTGPSGTFVITLEKNGVSFGTVTFAAGATTGVFSVASPVPVTPSDIITAVSPGGGGAINDMTITLNATS